MKEITRIHIAKVAYDIELDAKNDIEQYIKALERYANDPDILDDIEIRITELLSERGVAAGGVIAKDDVVSVRAQLGEPSDFAAEGAEEMIASESSGEESRRVYRDTENAIVGGVLSGLARFFNTDPLWVRLVFIVLLFASFGTALVVYLVLWLIVPPAETAAEKLRMSGQAVTLASIKELVKREDQQGERSRAAQRITSVIGGVFLLLVAIGGLLAIVAVVFGLPATGLISTTDGWAYGQWWFMAMMGLFVVSGLMFAALCFILASAVFQRQWTKRTGTAVTAIITVGLVAFASGAAMGMVGYVGEQERIASLSETRRIELTTETRSVKKLKIETAEVAPVSGHIEYIVSRNPRIEVAGLPGVEPEISVSDDNKTMTLKVTQFDNQRRFFWNYYMSPTFKIYGPALETIEVDDGGQTVSYYNSEPQDALGVIGEAGLFSLAGTYKAVTVKSKDTAAIELGDASIEQLEVDLSGGSVTAGVVRALSIKQADVCPAREYHDVRGSLQVQAVVSGEMTHNGKEVEAVSRRTECGAIIVGDGNPDDNHSL